MDKLLKVYVCKNFDDDGDLHIAVFTKFGLASEFCRLNVNFSYYEITITDNVDTEKFKYINGEM